MSSILLHLALVLSKLSLLSFGDTTSVLGEMQREVVSRGWVTNAQFTEAFALSRLTPGPGSVIVVPLGYFAAGWAGAGVALLASYLPTALLALGVVAVWQKVRTSSWPRAVRTAMLPTAIGLTAGTGYILGRATIDGLPALTIAAIALAVLLRTRLPVPLVILTGAAFGALVLRP